MAKLVAILAGLYLAAIQHGALEKKFRPWCVMCWILKLSGASPSPLPTGEKK